MMKLTFYYDYTKEKRVKKIKYVGSKNRISKYIAPIIQKAIDDNDIKVYYEPFVGGANMIDKIRCDKCIGNDIHKELIAMWQEIQNGWEFPMHISEEEYVKVRDNKNDYPDYYVGLVGFNATFGSKYFGGYARGFKTDKITPRDIPNEALRNLKSQIASILNVDKETLKNLIIELKEDYEKSDRGIRLSILGDAFKLTTKKEHKDYYEKLLEFQYL